MDKNGEAYMICWLIGGWEEDDPLVSGLSRGDVGAINEKKMALVENRAFSLQYKSISSRESGPISLKVKERNRWGNKYRRKDEPLRDKLTHPWVWEMKQKEWVLGEKEKKSV